jgi:hypothetical protein
MLNSVMREQHVHIIVAKDMPHMGEYVQPKSVLKLLCRSTQLTFSCCNKVHFLEISILSNQSVACLFEMADIIPSCVKLSAKNRY